MLIILSLMHTASQSIWNSFLITSGPSWACLLLIETASQSSTQCRQNREVTLHRCLFPQGQIPCIVPCKPRAEGWVAFAGFQSTHHHLSTCWHLLGPPMCGGWLAQAPQTRLGYPGHPARFSTFVFVLSSNVRWCLSVWAFLCYLGILFLFSLKGSAHPWSQTCGMVRKMTFFHFPACRWELSWGGAQPLGLVSARYLLL